VRNTGAMGDGRLLFSNQKNKHTLLIVMVVCWATNKERGGGVRMGGVHTAIKK